MAINPNSDAALEVEDQTEYFSYLYDSPIAEFAKYAGIDIDEAVKRRIEAILENTPPKVEAFIRKIEPRGNLCGFASVTVGGITINDFKIVKNNEGELFVGMPSRPDKASSTGYRNTVYVEKEYLNNLNNLIISEYNSIVPKQKHLPIADQIITAGKEAAEHNKITQVKGHFYKNKSERA